MEKEKIDLKTLRDRIEKVKIIITNLYNVAEKISSQDIASYIINEKQDNKETTIESHYVRLEEVSNAIAFFERQLKELLNAEDCREYFEQFKLRKDEDEKK